MRAFYSFRLFLGLIAVGAISAVGFSQSFEEQLSAEERAAIGLDKLSAEERAALFESIERYRSTGVTAAVAEVASKAEQEKAVAVEAAAVAAVDDYKKNEEPGMVAKALEIFKREEADKEIIEKALENLTVLNIGEKAEIVSISKACRKSQRRRLMDLGILPGTIVTAEMIGFGGDPTAYNIRGAKIALRLDTAQQIRIKNIEEAA
jgi:Fe2+ transport system protein FeoA